MNPSLFPVVEDPLQRISRLRCLAPGVLADVAGLQRDLAGSFERTTQRVRELGYPEHDAQDILYALVAHADEVALTSSEILRGNWLSSPMQRAFFGENTAGENFFLRLDAIRRDPQRRQVLLVYYFCLLLGFQGTYRVRGGTHELGALMAELRRELGPVVEPAVDLAPQGARPLEVLTQASSTWSVVRWPALATGVALLLYLGGQFALDFVTKDVAARIAATDVEERMGVTPRGIVFRRVPTANSRGAQ